MIVSTLVSFIESLSRWMRPHVSHIAMALVATLLVIYGSSINQLIRTWIQKLHFLVRIAVFVLLCSFGYAYFTLWASGIARSYLQALDNRLLAPGVIALFIIIGVLAERRNHI